METSLFLLGSVFLFGNISSEPTVWDGDGVSIDKLKALAMIFVSSPLCGMAILV
jgi:hypothetical protein